MAGRLFLQIPGPTNLPDRVVRAISQPIINHRGAEFAKLVKGLLPRLKGVFRTERGTPLIFPSSGTGVSEAALVNTLSPGDKVLCFTIGNFSVAYAKLARNLGFQVEEVALPWGSGVSEEQAYERLAADRDRGIKAVFTIQNETSTGVMTDLRAVRRALDRADHPALLVVDTVSGLGSIDFRMDEWGVDIAVTGSQKGLLLPPGLGMLCVSEKALVASQSAKSPRHYFDWAAMLENNRKGFFPYTPATTLLFGLDESLKMLAEEGLPNVFARHARLAEGVRKAVAAWGLKLVAHKPEEASNTITAVVTPQGVDADALIALAEARFNLALGNGLGPLSGKVFRIGHLGQLNELEVLATLGGVEMALRQLKHPVPLGSGVAAAQGWFLENGR
ncbi:MAG: aminotransferase class V-fold PLP-dependent enzyme [Candidatus Lambdaproteobacteria bacterium]|nr:aminotransferase class V-fold PLP-dependent enzyme [Candidatus Lambdaproteobacteria bacterium]